MDSKTYTCDLCGAEVGIGSFPFCKGDKNAHGQWTGAEQPCEEFFAEHLSTDGEHFTSRRAWVRFMDKHGFEPHKPRETYNPGRIMLDLGKR